MVPKVSYDFGQNSKTFHHYCVFIPSLNQSNLGWMGKIGLWENNSLVRMYQNYREWGASNLMTVKWHTTHASHTIPSIARGSNFIWVCQLSWKFRLFFHQLTELPIRRLILTTSWEDLFHETLSQTTTWKMPRTPRRCNVACITGNDALVTRRPQSKNRIWQKLFKKIIWMDA